MARSRQGAKTETPSIPAASRLTIRRKANRRRAGSLWSRLPAPRLVLSSCGRVVRRAVPVAVATMAISGVVAGVWAGYRFATTSPRFAISEITISGNHRVSSTDAIAALSFHEGENIFRASLDLTSLRANPWIASASAHRELPHGVTVEITERTPAAIVDLGGFYLADATGHVFKKLADEPEQLPIITGLDRDAYNADPDGTADKVKTALAALATWNAGKDRPQIGEIHVGAHDTLVLDTYEHATAIQLGALDAQLPSRMHTFDLAWAELGDAERQKARAVHIDDGGFAHVGSAAEGQRGVRAARTDHVTVAFAQD